MENEYGGNGYGNTQNSTSEMPGSVENNYSEQPWQENTGYTNYHYEQPNEESINNAGENYGSSFGESTEQNAQQYTYYTYTNEPQNEEEPPKKHKKTKAKKEATAGRKWARAIAMALVFGLVAGSVFYGVNYLGNRFIAPTGNAATAQAPENLPDREIFMNTEVSSQAESMNTTAITAKDIESTSSAELAEGTVAQVAANCLPSLVTISEVSEVEMQNMFGQKQIYEAQGAGSGVIVGMNDTELLIATNNHVVSSAKSVTVGFVDETTATALIKGTDEENDLAVIAVKLEDISEETLNNISIATLGNSDELVLGEQVVAIGNALGYGQSVTSGYVSALDIERTFSDGSGYFVSTDLIQTDAPINSGNSGGGLFNMKGELIGINEAKTSMTSSGVTVDGIGYAISIAKAEPILKELMELETREVVPEDERGYLGVTCASVTEDISASYNMPVGVCFTEVLSGSPAEMAGIKKGDVLTSINGQTVSTYEQLVSFLDGCRAGEQVELVIMRSSDGEYVEKNITVTLGNYEVIAEVKR